MRPPHDPMKIEENQIPVRRPHFEIRDNRLFFLISARPHMDLTPDEVELWNRCDGHTAVGSLGLPFATARDALARLWESEVIELVPESFPANRRKVIIIEPHMDDAVLSVGGRMWEMRDTHEFIVVTVAGTSNFTSYYKICRDYFDVGTVTALRRRESELAMRVLGGTHRILSGHDAPLRYEPGEWSLDWFRKNKRSISAYINHPADSAEMDARTSEIYNFLLSAEADEVWMPMGIGMSADHEATRNASLLALMKLTKSGNGKGGFFLYQDVPYGFRFPEHGSRILRVLEEAGAVLERMRIDVTGSMSAKLRLISNFASQFKMSYMEPLVRENGRANAGKSSEYGELMVRMRKPPAAIDLFELYSGEPQVRGLVRRLRAWKERNRQAARITVLCPMGVGRWREYMEVLLDEFPDSIIELHLTRDALEETKRFSSPRILIRPVDARGSAWLLRIAKVLLGFPRPLVVFTGWRFQGMTRLLRAALFPFDVVPAASICHVVEALRRLPASRGTVSAKGSLESGSTKAPAS